MFGRRERILDNVLDENVDVDLLEGIPHRTGFDIGQHNKFDIGGGLVVMQLVLRGAIGDEAAVSQSVGHYGMRPQDLKSPIIVPS